MTKTEQIVTYVIENINSGVWTIGDKIPTEKELCDKFDVSKMTANKALTKLQILGYISSIRGSGSYVRDTHHTKKTTQLLSFTENAKIQNKTSNAKLVHFQTTSEGNETAKKKLGISLDMIVHKIVRQRFFEKKLIALEITYLNPKIIPIIDAAQLEKSLYNYLENTLELDIASAEQKISLTYATEEISKLLNVEVNKPLFKSEQFTYDMNNNKFEYTISYINPDDYSFDFIRYRE